MRWSTRAYDETPVSLARDLGGGMLLDLALISVERRRPRRRMPLFL